jgi:hypothetical protein
MDNNLKSLISEKLNRTKKTILRERTEVKYRFKIIKELNKNKSKEKLIDDIITEMFYLNSNGYKKSVISENIIDWFKNLLGFGDNTMIEPVIDTFKESLLGYLIKIITPGSTNSYLANIVKTGLADIDMSDLSKLTDCEFLSDTITKAIVEGTVNKLKNNAGMTGGIYDVVRNGLVDQLDNMEFAKNIKEGINNFICDAIVDKISLLKDKIEDITG